MSERGIASRCWVDSLAAVVHTYHGPVCGVEVKTDSRCVALGRPAAAGWEGLVDIAMLLHSNSYRINQCLFAGAMLACVDLPEVEGLLLEAVQKGEREANLEDSLAFLRRRAGRQWVAEAQLNANVRSCS